MKAEEAEPGIPGDADAPASAVFVDEDGTEWEEADDGISNITVGLVKRIAVNLYKFIDIFVGVCFVVMAFFMIKMYHDYGITSDMFALTDWITLVAMLFGGTIMVFNPRRTFNMSIGFYAITMGIISFCSNWDSLGDGAGESESFFGTLITDVEFIVVLVMLGFSLNLIISGTSYLRGRPRGTVGMMFKAAMMMAMNIFTLVVSIRMGEYKSLWDAIRMEPVAAIQIIMFFIFLNVMDTDEARSYNTKNRLSASTEALRHNKTLDEKSFVLLQDVHALIDPEFKAWESPDDGGPVDYEYRFAINSTGGSSYVTVQRWKGKEPYYFTITDHERGSNIRATRFSASDMRLSDDERTFYIIGSDHFSIRMHVRHPVESLEVSWGRSE